MLDGGGKGGQKLGTGEADAGCISYNKARTSGDHHDLSGGLPNDQPAKQPQTPAWPKESKKKSDEKRPVGRGFDGWRSCAPSPSYLCVCVCGRVFPTPVASFSLLACWASWLAPLALSSLGGCRRLPSILLNETIDSNFLFWPFLHRRQLYNAASAPNV